MKELFYSFPHISLKSRVYYRWGAHVLIALATFQVLKSSTWLVVAAWTARISSVSRESPHCIHCFGFLISNEDGSFE